MRQINLDQIRSLIEVIACGSFTSAAHELNLTQPAVSLHVQELEHRFKVKLVDRVGRRVTPTSAGMELAAIGQRLLDQADDAQRIMRQYVDGFVGQVRMGMSMTVLIYLMPPVIRELKRTVPSLELSIRTRFSENTLQGVRDNELDLGLCTAPISDKSVECTEVGIDSLLAIFPSDAENVPDVITPAILKQWPFIHGNPRSALRHLVEEWIGVDGPVPRPAMELDNVAGIKSVVGAGLGASVVPQVAIGDDGEAGRLLVRPLDPPISRSLLLVQRKDKTDDAAIRHVRAALLANMSGRS